jgi:F-type H+-transporting ATPase subunit epsilon
MIQLQIITLTGVFMDKEVFEVDVPTTAGKIAVNGGHAPLAGAIKPGVLTIKHQKTDSTDSWEQVAVYEGTIEVLRNVVTILVDDVDTPDEVSEAEAQKALDKAKELTAKAGDAMSLAEAQSAMDRSAVRLQLASLKSRSKKR